MFSQRDLIDIKEASDLSAPLSSVVPRWQRKALAAQNPKTPSKSAKTPTSKKTPAVSKTSMFIIVVRAALC